MMHSTSQQQQQQGQEEDTTTTTSSSRSNHLSLGAIGLRKIVLDSAQKDIRASIDLFGILWLEHINLVVGSNRTIAEYFYIHLLGCTPDAGSSSFHVNLGQQQFHLATTNEMNGPIQIIAGSIGLVVPNLRTIRERIPNAQIELQNTQFTILEDGMDFITIRCPDGNIFHLYSVQDNDDNRNESSSSSSSSTKKMVTMHSNKGIYGPNRMSIRGGQPGIRYIEIACPMNTANRIAQFYNEILSCAVHEISILRDVDVYVNGVVVTIGNGIHLVFIENDNDLAVHEAIQKMNGVHICVYVNEFYTIYQRLTKYNLIWTNPRFVHLDTCDTYEEAVASRTLRFKDIIDVNTGIKILELEHETRPITHGQYLKVPKYEPR